MRLERSPSPPKSRGITLSSAVRPSGAKEARSVAFSASACTASTVGVAEGVAVDFSSVAAAPDPSFSAPGEEEGSSLLSRCEKSGALASRGSSALVVPSAWAEPTMGPSEERSTIVSASSSDRTTDRIFAPRFISRGAVLGLSLRRVFRLEAPPPWEFQGSPMSCACFVSISFRLFVSYQPMQRTHASSARWYAFFLSLWQQSINMPR